MSERPVKRTCPARWSPAERGYIRVVHPTTREVADIPYRAATEIWRDDVRELARRRRRAEDDEALTWPD